MVRRCKLFLRPYNVRVVVPRWKLGNDKRDPSTIASIPMEISILQINTVLLWYDFFVVPRPIDEKDEISDPENSISRGISSFAERITVSDIKSEWI